MVSFVKLWQCDNSPRLTEGSSSCFLQICTQLLPILPRELLGSCPHSWVHGMEHITVFSALKGWWQRTIRHFILRLYASVRIRGILNRTILQYHIENISAPSASRTFPAQMFSSPPASCCFRHKQISTRSTPMHLSRANLKTNFMKAS